jgi:Domain of unknown function (DUF4082)/Right handed beta helix region
MSYEPDIREYSLFNSKNPVTPACSDSGSVELGLRFKPIVDGKITGIRFYKGRGNTGTHYGSLWSTAGTRLGYAKFNNETYSGWQTLRYTNPVKVKSGIPYIVSYFAPKGHYAGDVGGFASPIVKGPLTALNSVYRYGTSSRYPNQTWRNTNYWVDVIFEADVPTVAPEPPKPTEPPVVEPEPPKPTEPPTQPPPSGGVPGPDNTGVPTGTTLASSGSITVTQSGAIVEGKSFNGGQVAVNASNVTIRKCRFTGNGSNTMAIRPGNGTVIEDCEINGNYVDAAVIGGGYTIRRCDISGLPADGLKMGSNTTIDSNWLHDFRPVSGAHGDGVQIQDGITNCKIINNHINCGKGTGHNAALFLCPDFGPTTDGPLLIEGNTLGGGGFTVYIVDGNNGQYFIRNITIRNNKFIRNSYEYAPTRINMPVTSSGNVFSDNGSPAF